MNLNDIYKQVAKEFGYTEKEVRYIYGNFWKYIRDRIQELPFKGKELTEEEFNKLRTNFSINPLGKLCCTYNQYKRHMNYIKHRNKENEDSKS